MTGQEEMTMNRTRGDDSTKEKEDKEDQDSDDSKSGKASDPGDKK